MNIFTEVYRFFKKLSHKRKTGRELIYHDIKGSKLQPQVIQLIMDKGYVKGNSDLIVTIHKGVVIEGRKNNPQCVFVEGGVQGDSVTIVNYGTLKPWFDPHAR